MSHSENVVELLHAGQFDKMATEIEKALQVDSAELLADLAEYLSMMGFSSESRQVYEAISQENTANTDIILNLAEMKVDDGAIPPCLFVELPGPFMSVTFGVGQPHRYACLGN